MCGRKKKPEPHEHDARLYYQTPPPRLHGTGCAMELAMIEKHSAHCRHNKIGGPDRNPIDDDIGSFYVVGRIGYESCARPCGPKAFVGGSDGSHMHHNGSARRSSAMSRSRSRGPSYMSAIYEEDGGSHTTAHHHHGSFRHSHSPSRSPSEEMDHCHSRSSPFRSPRHSTARHSMAHSRTSRVPSSVLEELERDEEPGREISVQSPSGNIISVRNPAGPDEYGPTESEIQISIGKSPRKSVAYPSPSSMVSAQSAPTSRSSSYYSATDGNDVTASHPSGHRPSARQSILIRDRASKASHGSSRMTATISDDNIDINIFNDEDEDDYGKSRASTIAH